MDLSPTATEREVRVRYRLLARIYHPDVHKPESTGLSNKEAEAYFQLLNNAQSYLRSHLL